MSTGIFGPKLDIHISGIDLTFPHHPKEIAPTQSRSQTNWVGMFLHTRYLSIDWRKMAKSLKNFITIRDTWKEHERRIFKSQI